MKIVNCEIGGEIVYFVVKIKIKIVKHFLVFLGDPPQNPLFFSRSLDLTWFDLQFHNFILRALLFKLTYSESTLHCMVITRAEMAE
jgi:hypothetical protein